MSMITPAPWGPQKDALLDKSLFLLKKIVSVDSSPKNIPGVLKVQQLLIAELDQLGFKVNSYPHENREYAPLLIAKYGDENKPVVSLVMHADTVLENNDLYPSKLEGDWFYGPGVIDNKGGIVVALMALKMFLKKAPSPDFQIHLVCVPNEEVGSLGFHKHLKAQGKKSKVIIGFEPAVANNIIHSRHGNRWYDIEIKGIEAHSGRCSGEELNAAHEFSYKLQELLKLKNEVGGIKLNIGSVQSASDTYNVVCGSIKVKLDLRFINNEVRDTAHKKIVEILDHSYTHNTKGKAVETKYRIADDCPAFSHVSKYGELTGKLLDLISKSEGSPIEAGFSGGASDVNYMFHSECFAIDGMGAVGEGMHTRNERVFIPSLITRSSALSDFLDVLSTQFPD